MKRDERLQRRLSIAASEAQDADRILRLALERVVPADDEAAAAVAARQVHAGWQGRAARGGRRAGP